ncbi:hypothetical protein ACP275_02G173500 [Erythranthe tilingii]
MLIKKRLLLIVVQLKDGVVEQEDHLRQIGLRKRMTFWGMRLKNSKGRAGKKSATRLLPGRTDTQCLHRWGKVIKPDLVKGPWSKEEDDLLVELVGKLGKKWREIEKHLPGRIGKQCRERWFNHLNPEINKAAWTKEEETVLIGVHAQYGNKWSEISKFLPGRTENSVKNHWNGSLKRKLDLNGNKAETRGNFPEANRNQTTNCLQKANLDSGENGKSRFLDLTSVLDECYSKYAQSFLYSTRDLSYCDDISYNNLGMENNSSEFSYTGLWYKPFQKGDMKIFLSTGRFPSTDRYIRRQNRSISLEPSRSNTTKLSTDLLSELTSMLKCAAMSYGNMPSIIRKRTSENDFSTRD